MFSGVVSLRQNTCAQVYSTEFHRVKVYPMRRKADAHLTLSTLFHDVGVFHTIVPDNAPELIKGELKKKAMSSRLLTNKAQVISRTSVIPLSTEDRNSKIVEQQIVKFYKEVADALGDRIAGIPPDSEEEETIVPYEDNSGETPHSVYQILMTSMMTRIINLFLLRLYFR
jgi:hypothetical protein